MRQEMPVQEPVATSTPDRSNAPESPIQPLGIDALTGRHLLPPLTAQEVAQVVFGTPPLGSPEQESTLALPKVVPPDLDWNDLKQTGWAVILTSGPDPEIQKALSPLLEHRRKQAGWMFKTLFYSPGETALNFLARHHVGRGVVDPEVMPYYLLIVGSPEEIPFSFQYQLGTGYGVGRLFFEDMKDYGRYACHAVQAETEGTSCPKVLSLFGAENDATTRRTTCDFIAPLAARLIRKTEDWQVRTWIRQDATKSKLSTLLGEEETPGILVTAGHGLSYPKDDPQQLDRQGSLVCHEWPGEGAESCPETNHVFTADDVSTAAKLQGLFAFFFGCYGAGTPRDNDFAHTVGDQHIASQPFIAKLPQRLLRQGALGVIGHVDRAWTCTFNSTARGRHVETPATVLQQLANGHRAGHALSFFGHRYAQLATELTQVWDTIRKAEPRPDDPYLAWLWTTHNDARNMILLGDPAARRVDTEE